MRITRMRFALAGVVGMTLLGVTNPAWAQGAGTPTPSPTAEATATATADTTGTPTPGIEVDVDIAAESTSSPTPTTTTTDGGAPTADLSATPTGDAAAAPSSTETPTEVQTTTGDPFLDGILNLLPFKLNLDPDESDLTFNPLLLTFTCAEGGPDWKIQNVSDKPYGFGWFDTSLGGGVHDIQPGQVIDLPSTAMAVIASPWDFETKVLLVTVPSVGVSDCPGTAPVAPVAATGLPAATPATAVPGEPYYTR